MTEIDKLRVKLNNEKDSVKRTVFYRQIKALDRELRSL